MIQGKAELSPHYSLWPSESALEASMKCISAKSIKTLAGVNNCLSGGRDPPDSFESESFSEFSCSVTDQNGETIMNDSSTSNTSLINDTPSTKNAIANIDLAYNYTEKFLESRKNNAKHLDWRLGTFLGFAGILLRFSSDLATNSPIWLLSTKALVITISLGSIICAARGLTSISKMGRIRSESLMTDEFLADTNTKVKEVVIKIDIKAINELSLLVLRKQFCLNWSIFCLVISAILFGVNLMADVWLNHR